MELAPRELGKGYASGAKKNVTRRFRCRQRNFQAILFRGVVHGAFDAAQTRQRSLR